MRQHIVIASFYCFGSQSWVNLLKNQAGLETVRVRSQQATMARCTLSSIAVLLIKLAGQRKKVVSVKKPQQIPMFPTRKAA
jgi:hypothetical protein